jgi:cold shock CspA family protein
MIAYVDEFGNITDTPPDPKDKKKVKKEDIEIAVPRQAPPNPEDLIRKGKVAFFNSSKGYGFIRDKDTQESIFVHVNGLTEEIQEGDNVTFETEKGPKGLNAINVKRV